MFRKACLVSKTWKIFFPRFIIMIYDMELEWVTTGYKALQGVTRGYKGLQGGYKGLEGVRRGYKGL